MGFGIVVGGASLFLDDSVGSVLLVGGDCIFVLVTVLWSIDV